MTSHAGLLTLLLMSFAAFPVTADCADTTRQDLVELTAAAEAAVAARGAGVLARADAPDPRLRLPRCDRDLAATVPAPAKGPRLSVRIACNGATPWSVLLPVQVETEAEILVARQALVPGKVLDAEAMALSRRRIPGFADCCARDDSALIGRRVRRPIAADAPIPLDSLETAPLVRRGEIVTVVAGSPGFEVRASGVALADALEGDALRIRHTTSLRIIQARAYSRGVVRVD